MSIEDEVLALRGEAAAQARRQAGAEAGQAQADGRAEAVREDLRAEFGVTTVAQARALQAETEQLLAAEMAEVRRLLVLAGGPQ